MKNSYLFIFGAFIIILLWAISPLGIFDIFNKQKINLEKTVSKEINKAIEVKKIVRPIEQTTLIIYKKEQLGEVWITDKNNQNHLIFSDSILIKNTQNGTRLYNEETIIPEGIYRIETINSKELSFVIDFPNIIDIEKQKADKRPDLTSNITFAITNNDLELSKELMTEFLFLAKEAEVKNTQILLLPNDFRNNKLIPNCLTCPFWIEELYGSLRVYLNAFFTETQ